MMSPFLGLVARAAGGARAEPARRAPATVRLGLSAGSRGTRTRAMRSRAARQRARYACRSGGSGELDLDPLAGERVREREPRRVQELPLERRVGRAVDRVADDRQARSPRGGRGSGASAPSRAARAAARARARSRSTSKCVTASRGVSVSSETRVGSRAVAADRRLDAPRPRARPAARRARGTCARAPRRRTSSGSRRCASSRARDDQQPRRVAVEPVDDAGPLRARRPRRAAASASTSVPVACPAPGWTTSPAGLSTTSRCSSSYDDPQASGSGASERARPRSAAGSSTSSPPSSR